MKKEQKKLLIEDYKEMAEESLAINKEWEVADLYLEKLDKIRKGKYLRFDSIEELRKDTN